MICVPAGKKDDPDEGCPITGITFDINKVDESWRNTYRSPMTQPELLDDHKLRNIFYTKANWQFPVTSFAISSE